MQTLYKSKEKVIQLGNKIIDECYIDDFMPTDFVKAKAKIFLSTLIGLKNFTLPKIFPTLRNTIQFEWEYFPDSEDHKYSEYFEFEIYEDMISMLYCDTTGIFSNREKGEYFHCNRKFSSETIDGNAENDYWRIFRFLEDMENIKESYFSHVLELFTYQYEEN